MTANLFDAGDEQRLEREMTLTDQRPRQQFTEDRSPEEDPLDTVREEENPFNAMLDGLLAALKSRL